MPYQHESITAAATTADERSGAAAATACPPDEYGSDGLFCRPLRAQPSSAGAGEGRETERLHAEIIRLHREIDDYQIALLTSNEHGDLLQDHLYRLSTSLASEIRERQTTDEKLQKFVQALSREKGDLQTLVQILIDQGDEAAEEGEKARIDGLTQIANRRRFDEYLTTEWGRHVRTQEPLSLLICDVDHFKLFNDGYGHQAGDECLKVVAAVIGQCCRAGDMVARYGGEEFAAILPHTGHTAAHAVAERIRAALATAGLAHSLSPICGQVTLSIGIGCKIPQRQDGSGSRSLIEEADRHLYLAKHRGRNRTADSIEENTRT